MLRVALSFTMLAACSSPAAPAPAAPAGDPTQVGGDRKVTVYVPASYDGQKPFPLVILLHGYSVSGLLQEIYMQFKPVAESRGFLYANPDGTLDMSGKRFWNPSPSGMPDDDGYLMGLVHEIEKNFRVDPKRVYFVGHSNGGFMAFYLACKHPDEIAAIATLAGAMWESAKGCTTTPVSLLDLHGTGDTTVSYDGGELFGMKFAGAKTSALDWVAIDGCDPTADESAAPIDVDGKIAGNETTIARWGKCKAATGVELWTMAGSPHIPLPLAPGFAGRVADFLLAHPKP